MLYIYKKKKKRKKCNHITFLTPRKRKCDFYHKNVIISHFWHNASSVMNQGKKGTANMWSSITCRIERKVMLWGIANRPCSRPQKYFVFLHQNQVNIDSWWYCKGLLSNISRSTFDPHLYSHTGVSQIDFSHPCGSKDRLRNKPLQYHQESLLT